MNVFTHWNFMEQNETIVQELYDMIDPMKAAGNTDEEQSPDLPDT